MERNQKIDSVLFDLDGTLWDSSESVAKAWSEKLQQLGYSLHISGQDLKNVMGLSMDQVSEKLLSSIDGDRTSIGEVCAKYENEYLKSHQVLLYDNVREVLEYLKKRGIFTGIISNCQTGYIEAFLQSFNLEDLVLDFQCYGQNQRPKDENIRIVIERNNLKNPVYVGDTKADMESAQKAGVPFIHAAYGFGKFAHEPQINCLCDLIGLLKEN